MTKGKREIIPNMCSRETQGTTTMLFSFEGEDAKSSIAQELRPIRDVDLDKFRTKSTSGVIPCALLFNTYYTVHVMTSDIWQPIL